MSKKLIIALLAIAILVSCLFVACGEDKKEENKPYIDGDEYEFVTDENGNKVLDENGEFIVYETDEDGKVVTNENGEKVTKNQLFEAYSGEGFYEDYGYKIELPEGWKATNEKGAFINEELQAQVSISVVNKTYQDYYESNINTYQYLKDAGIKVTWSEEVKGFSEECQGVVRFTMEGEGAMSVMYFYKNGGNIYKVLYETTNGATAIKNSEEICSAMSYKPFDYYEPITDALGNEIEDEIPTKTETTKE